MADFIRARSPEQKGQRLADIKAMARSQFAERPYHEITLTTIAEGLGWSRANLYKYVTTKEEIFLLLSTDERDAYYDALLAALPEGRGLAPAEVAETWADVASAHQEWFRLSHLLLTIIETNVTLARLVDFKRDYHERLPQLEGRLSKALGIQAAQVEPLLNTVSYHAEGLVSRCTTNPLVVEALAALGRKPVVVDFQAEMASFVGMCLERARG